MFSPKPILPASQRILKLHPPTCVCAKKLGLAVIDARESTLQIIHATGHPSPPVPLIAPGRPSFPPTANELPTTELAVIDATADPNGDLLLAASPYRPAEGVRILRFDTAGRCKATLRLAMPELSPSGERLGVSKIALIGHRLFLGASTSTGLQIAYFDLPH